jgi:hypothetical protein
MTRRTALALLGTTLARAAGRLPANKNVRWALGANLWSSFERVPFCHRVLKSIGFKGWLCVDLDIARKGPRASYERCGEYVVNKLESIYV